MISQMNHGAGADTEPRSDASLADQVMSRGQIRKGEALRSIQLERIAVWPAPKVMRTADGRALEAYIERRRRLAARIRLENPARTEEEIEARLEQFGA
jgi:hypothetical protein